MGIASLRIPQVHVVAAVALKEHGWHHVMLLTGMSWRGDRCAW